MPQRVFNPLFSAIKREDRVLRRLFEGRLGYEGYAPGLATAYETGTVYAIFKGLIDRLPKGWRVDWEGPHGKGHKRIDLVISPRGRKRWGIEVKWWTKGGAGVVYDCNKLLGARLGRRFILAFKIRISERQHTLEWLINRRLHSFGIRVIASKQLSTFVSGQRQALLDVVLFELSGRPR